MTRVLWDLGAATNSAVRPGRGDCVGGELRGRHDGQGGWGDAHRVRHLLAPVLHGVDTRHAVARNVPGSGALVEILSRPLLRACVACLGAGGYSDQRHYLCRPCASKCRLDAYQKIFEGEGAYLGVPASCSENFALSEPVNQHCYSAPEHDFKHQGC